MLIIFEVAYRSNLYIFVPHNHARKISRNVYSNYLHLLTARKVNHAKSKSKTAEECDVFRNPYSYTPRNGYGTFSLSKRTSGDLKWENLRECFVWFGFLV